MNRVIRFVFMLIMVQSASGQVATQLMKGSGDDSSFYAVRKISSNEFWVGGKNGVLKRIDSLGNISSIAGFPNDESDILKIERLHNYVYLTTSKGCIYRYDINAKVFIKKQFPSFKNKCFYDMLFLKDGSLLVCGGTSAIARGSKVIPRGFIAQVDSGLNTIKVLWHSGKKFVWALADMGSNGIDAATYNGFNSKIINSANLISWHKLYRVKGLVHSTTVLGNTLCYSGTKTMRYSKGGIFGFTAKDCKQCSVQQSGCIWHTTAFHDSLFAVTYSGEIMSFDKNGNIGMSFRVPGATTLYCIEKVSATKLLVAGHGKEIYMVEFSK